MGRVAPDPQALIRDYRLEVLTLTDQTSTSHKTKHFSKYTEGGFAEAKDKTSRKCSRGYFQELLMVTFPISTCHLCGFTDQDAQGERL